VRTLTRVRLWLVLFVIGLVLSGITAFPLRWEVDLLDHALHGWLPGPDALVGWIDRVHEGITYSGDRYPFLAYGTDWLAFAHLVIAVAFWGPIRDPVRNVWVVHFGMIACVGVIPLALIAGPMRGIPFWWTVIDMSFGVFGMVPLWFALRGIQTLAAGQPAVTAPVPIN
jgi:hypothetical protein